MDNNALGAALGIVRSLPGTDISRAETAAVAAEAAANAAVAAAQSLTVDSAMSSSSTNPVQNKVIYGELSELKADLTAVETDIETGDLTAGTAKQLLADTGMTDKSPYLFRAMPTGAGDREEPVIVGGSVVWNQMVVNGDFSDGVGNWKTPASYGTLAVADGKATITTTTQNVNQSIYGTVANPTKDHVYLIEFDVTISEASPKLEVYWGKAGIDKNLGSVAANTKTHAVCIAKAGTQTATTTMYIYPNSTSGMSVGATAVFENIRCHDLTAMFRTAIADYVNTLGNTAGIAYLRKYGFFTKDYYPHTEPTFKHVEGLTAHKMVGFNQWDGTYRENVWLNSNSTGAITGANGYNLTDYIPVIPGKRYYHSEAGSQRSLYYDKNKALVGAGAWANAGQYAGTFVVPEGAYYIRFTVTNANIANFIINLSDPAKNGTYEPYKSYTYPLDTDVVLRGIPKLDANNDLYYDGDTYEADGTVTRKYGVITFNGSVGESWSHYTISSEDNANELFRITVSGRKSGAIPSGACGVFTERYAIAENNGTKRINLTISGSDTKIDFVNKDYSTVEAWKTYLASNPITVVYELATPTTETADPYAPLQLADPYGTEEWVLDDEAFPMPVGQETFYPENLRAKIEGLPWNFANLIAPTEVSNVATRNYTAGNLLIVDNILYKVTVNIANGGTITPGTNVVATTLAEIISALQ